MQQKIFITRHVWEELQSWLNKPFSNEQIADRIKRAAIIEDYSIVLDHRLTWEQDCYAGRSYYANLLSVRKQRSRQLVHEFRTKHNREPTPEEVNRLFQMNGGERDFQLLRKGFADFGKVNYSADEDLISAAATVGLRTGRPTTIFTRDGDLLEQFQKMTSLLTLHYQALLFAERYAIAPSEFQTCPMTVSGALQSYFDCAQSFLVKKPIKQPDDFVEWLLPSSYQELPLTCALLGGQPPDMTISFIIYRAEKDMLRLIRTQGNTGGRSTDRLGSKNCHVTGFPEGIDDPRSWIVVGADRTESFLGTNLAVPRLDLRHVVEHREVLRRMPDREPIEPARE